MCTYLSLNLQNNSIKNHDEYINFIDDTIIFRRFLKEIFWIYLFYFIFCLLIIIIFKYFLGKTYNHFINIPLFFGFLGTMILIFQIYKEYNIKYNIFYPFIMISVVNFILFIINIYIKIPVWIQIIINFIMLIIGIMNSSIYESNGILITLGIICLLIQLLVFLNKTRHKFLGFGFFFLFQ